MGRDAKTKINNPWPRCFNPRARMGRDGVALRRIGRWKKFQSTRPHGARRYERGGNRGQEIVSIHAPAWGATFPHAAAWRGCAVSIHAPAWGATCYVMQSETFREVSIHAPAWGATPVAKHTDLTNSFQSTRPHGARQGLPGRSPPPWRCFNPRARMGRDLQ